MFESEDGWFRQKYKEYKDRYKRWKAKREGYRVSSGTYLATVPTKHILRHIAVTMKFAISLWEGKHYEEADKQRHFAAGLESALTIEEGKEFISKYPNLTSLIFKEPERWVAITVEDAKEEIKRLMEL